ncbi:hypothetical protein NP233_g5613 [Leucocoprinus birnbaumii]|uniref:Uncharacterized protein n=1 Tax=Leucocoprinus birnbaumii TaxID=56174 RepID=A0AAD5VYN4_9AGAR|nr:hypothetical protein NP233_g5613 [Leucocoprinus birnbaumii]
MPQILGIRRTGNSMHIETERLAREQDARINSLLGSQNAAGNVSHHNPGVGSTAPAVAAPAAYASERNAALQTAANGSADRTDAGNVGTKGERRGGQVASREAHNATNGKKPGIMDRLLSKSSKGEERVNGLARN